VSTQLKLKNILITLGTKVSLFAVMFHRTSCRNFDTFGAKKFDTEQWAVCDASNCNTNLTKDVNNETLTLNSATREEF